MNSMSIPFLKVLVVLTGIGALAFLLWEPHVEGVNAHATTLSEIYFDDPFLAFAYIASIPFFVGLYQAFKLLGYAGRNDMGTRHSAKALTIIQYCACIMIVSVVIGVTWLLQLESDDRPPIIGMGTMAALVFTAVAAASHAYGRKLRRM